MTSGEIAILVVYLCSRYLLPLQDVAWPQTLHSWPQCKHFYLSHSPEENNYLYWVILRVYALLCQMGPCCTFQLANDPHSLAAGLCLCGLSWKSLLSSDSPSFVLCVTWLGSQQAPLQDAGAAWDRLMCVSPAWGQSSTGGWRGWDKATASLTRWCEVLLDLRSCCRAGSCDRLKQCFPLFLWALGWDRSSPAHDLSGFWRADVSGNFLVVQWVGKGSREPQTAKQSLRDETSCAVKCRNSRWKSHLTSGMKTQSIHFGWVMECGTGEVNSQLESRWEYPGSEWCLYKFLDFLLLPIFLLSASLLAFPLESRLCPTPCHTQLTDLCTHRGSCWWSKAGCGCKKTHKNSPHRKSLWVLGPGWQP